MNQPYSQSSRPHQSQTRPPLPDYHVATQMALMRQNQAFYGQNHRTAHTRSRSFDGLVNYGDYYHDNDVSDDVLVDDGKLSSLVLILKLCLLL